MKSIKITKGGSKTPMSVMGSQGGVASIPTSPKSSVGSPKKSKFPC